MKRYQIKCGEIDDFYFARNEGVAFRALMKRHKNPLLSPLVKFREVDSENKRIGKWSYQDPQSLLESKKIKKRQKK